MQEITLVFPHQLYESNPALAPGRQVFLLEDPLFFNQYAFHRQKIWLHRAGMKYYQDHLTQKGMEVTYVDAWKDPGQLKILLQDMKEAGVQLAHYADTTDYLLERRLKRWARQSGLQLSMHASPNFIVDREEADAFFNRQKKYFLHHFYIDQRKRKGILLDGKEPAGGKWSLDAENRKRLPARMAVPDPVSFHAGKWGTEASEMILKNYLHNPGNWDEERFPVTHAEARRGLDLFLAHRLKYFGDYQDAMAQKHSFLFHSLLSAPLNAGLLNPQEVLDKALEAGKEYRVPLNALEGFVRQLLGWREYIRMLYLREGVRERTRNFWGFSRKIPPAFYEGNTGILPVDFVIKKVLQTGYAHHIERLMVLGNFMCLCEFDPDEVYRWFMEMFVDAYDWVMVPNVYGMSQFADAGLMSTKPYISGSNYILKMSDFPKGPWCEIWDALFWRFLQVHRDFFRSQPRMSILLANFDRMPADRRNHLLNQAESFLAALGTVEV